MANIVEQTPNTAEKAISLLDNIQLGGTATKKIDYSSVRGKVISSLNYIQYGLIHTIILMAYPFSSITFLP